MEGDAKSPQSPDLAEPRSCANGFISGIWAYKRNFGFFYNALGKALFIIFMGLLCFGVEAGSLGVITGLAVAIDGGLLILLFLKYPHMYPKD